MSLFAHRNHEKIADFALKSRKYYFRKVKRWITMKMTEKEYKELVNIFRYLRDKCDSCYEREVDNALAEFEEEYRKYIV